MPREKQRRRYRLGLDLGSNSVGWFMVWLDGAGEPIGLGPGGVRIFPDGRDPKSKESNAKDRRVARGMRRRRDRYLRRRSQLLEALARHGLMPPAGPARKALEAIDPYGVRAAALDGPQPLHHLGRALFHLDQRRGFQSNRKSDPADNESGLIRAAVARLEEAMAAAGSRTLGEFLHRRRLAGKAVRARLQGAGKDAAYDFYPARALVAAEFDALWAAQAPHHPEMTAAAWEAIRHIIFFQRPLRTPPVGKCALSPAQSPDDAEGFRCPRAHPLAQRFRIWQEVRNLRIEQAGEATRPLTRAEGDRIALALFAAKAISFDKMRSLLKLPPEARFNLESDKRNHLKGDETAARLGGAKLYGKAWYGFPLDRQCALVERLLEAEDEDALVAWLAAETGIDQETAARVAGTLLPDGHARLGLRALRRVLPHLAEGLPYDKACAAAGFDHAQGPTGEVVDRLPYYGAWLKDDVVGTGDPKDPPEQRFGRLPNPTVHIGLGQLRRLVNALVDRYGPPAQVVVEMTRSFKLSPDELAKVEKEQATNQARNDRRRADLQALGLPDTRQNLLKLRLWEELNPGDPLDRCCPYTGEKISREKLLSEEVDIDHLIPFQVSLDDSAANKIVCLSRANRHKGKRTPYQAFGQDPAWEAIAARAANLPKGKRWRFAPDALERFKEQDGFLGRQLNETGWLARMAKSYLSALTGPYQTWVIPGRLTAIIRGKWGLNPLLPDHNFTDAKNRADHRHHALDALVAALTDRALLQKMARAYDEERERIAVPLPWPSLRDELIAWRDRMTVSHKAEHGTGGRLHEDTAYGLVKDPAAEGANLVYRKAFTALRESEIGRIRDRRLRDMVAAHWAEAKSRGQKIDQALATFAATVDDPHVSRGIRHVRLLKPEKPDYLVPITAAGGGDPYKAYAAGENAFIDILEAADGKWLGEATTVFKVNDPTYCPAWQGDPALRFVMRLHKGDLLRLERDGRAEIMVVRRLEPSASRVRLAGHADGGNLDRRHDNPDDPFRWLMPSYGTLKAMGAERVRVDAIGRVWRVRPGDGRRHIVKGQGRHDRPGG